MPSTRRQKTKARKHKEIDILSGYGYSDVMLGDGTSNPKERELDIMINCPDRHQDLESTPKRGSSSQESEIRNIDNRNGPVRQDGLPESIEILLSRMNVR